MTFDDEGNVKSRYIPPRNADGSPMDPAEWLRRVSVRRLEKGETPDQIQESLYRNLGNHVVWHGYSEYYAESVRGAISAVREAAGIGGRPNPWKPK